MEVTKDLQKDCSGVIVTLSQANADYTVMLNRESKHNRGLLRTNSQVQVANRLGDILGTNATRTVGNASKDACQLIIADWSQHGKIIVQDPPVPTPAPAEAPDKAKAEAVSAAESQPAATSPVVGPDSQGQNSTPASGRRQIDSIPSGADIEVDGSFVGNTPSDLQLAQGDHVIVIKKSGFKNWERKLKSSGGSNVHIGAELEKADAT
jgi:hypothetical protein